MAYNDYANQQYRLQGPARFGNQQVGRLGTGRAAQGLPCLDQQQVYDLLASCQRPIPHHHRQHGAAMRQAMNLAAHRNLLQQAAVNNMYNELAQSIENQYSMPVAYERPRWVAHHRANNPPPHCPEWRRRGFEDGSSRTADNIARGVGAFALALGAASLISRIG